MVVGGPTVLLDLGGPATGLAPWASHAVPRPDGSELTVTAVPAVHGPEDGERDADGFINCEVIGFVLSGTGLPTVYLSDAQLRLGDHGQWIPLNPALAARDGGGRA